MVFTPTATKDSAMSSIHERQRLGSPDRPGSAARPKSAIPGSGGRSREIPVSQFPSGSGRKAVSARNQGAIAWELEAARDELYFQHELAEASAERVRELELERGQLTHEYQASVRDLDDTIAQHNTTLQGKRAQVQERQEELTTAVAHEKKLALEHDRLSKILQQERLSIARVREEYAIKEKELDKIIQQQEKLGYDLEVALRLEQDTSHLLKKKLVQLRQEVLAIRQSRRHPPLSSSGELRSNQVEVAEESGGPAAGAGLGMPKEVFLFRMEIAELLQGIKSKSIREEQFVTLQRMLEDHVVVLRQIFRYYCFHGAVGANNPFSISGRQFIHLTKDCRMKVDQAQITNAFVQVILTYQTTTTITNNEEKAKAEKEKAKREAMQKPETINKIKGQVDKYQLDFDQFVEVLIRLAVAQFGPKDSKDKKEGLPESPEPDAKQGDKAKDGKKNKGEDKPPPPKPKSGKGKQGALTPDFPNMLQRLLEGFILPRAHRMKPDQFLEEYMAEDVQAAVKEIRAIMHHHFFATLEPNQITMSCPQWLAFAKRRQLIGPQLSVARAALIFVEVADSDFLEQLKQEAMDLAATKDFNEGEQPSNDRKMPALTKDGFEECIVRVAKEFFKSDPDVIRLSEQTIAFSAQWLED